MAVSYVSKPYKSDPYVLPFDLNLFSKVMQYKQAKFDANAQKEQGQIDQMGSLDVMKSQDREYLNGKIKNLVDGVNNLGGVDFSDNNVANQIEGFGSDIYSDDKVLTAIGGTKAVRALTGGYQAMKSNPKTSKGYSPVNEAYDMKSVNAWVNDGQVGSAYNGPSAPTAYTPYRENHLKAFNQLKANYREKITDKGLVYVNEANEEVTPERVMQMASDLLLPDERLQMKKDAWYLYKDVAPTQIVQKSLDFNNQKIQRAKDIYDNYRANAEAATSDPIARQNYLNLAQKQRSELNTLLQGSQEIAKNGVKRFQENPEEYMYNVYSNDYFRGLSERFAYSKNTTKITPNTAEMFKERQAQLHDQFKQTLDFNKQKFEKDYELQMLKLGAKTFKDPLTGKTKRVDFGLTNTNINTADVDKYKINETTYKNENASLEVEKQGLALNLIRGIVRKDPTLGNLISTTETGTGVVSQLRGIEGLTNTIPGKPGFNIENLNIDLNNPQTKKWMAQNHITDKQAAFLKNIYTNYQALSEGKPVDISKLPDGFSDFVEKYQLINEKIRANDAKVSGVNQVANAQAGITDEDMAFYNDYSKRKEQSEVVIPNEELNPFAEDSNENIHLDTNGESYKYLNDNRARFDKIKQKAELANKLKADLYKQVENRPVFQQKQFVQADPLVKSGALPGLFLKILSERGDSQGKNVGQTYPLKDITNMWAGRSADGSDSYDLTADVTGKDGLSSTVSVKLTGDQAEQLGFTNDPYTALNESVSLSGRSGDLLIRGGKDLVGKINVVKVNDDRNDLSSYTQIVLPTGDPSNPNLYVDLPGTEGLTPSEAYAKAKELIQNYAKLGGTLQQFQKDILNEHYNK